MVRIKTLLLASVIFLLASTEGFSAAENPTATATASPAPTPFDCHNATTEQICDYANDPNGGNLVGGLPATVICCGDEHHVCIYEDNLEDAIEPCYFEPENPCWGGIMGCMFVHEMYHAQDDPSADCDPDSTDDLRIFKPIGNTNPEFQCNYANSECGAYKAQLDCLIDLAFDSFECRTDGLIYEWIDLLSDNVNAACNPGGDGIFVQYCCQNYNLLCDEKK